MVVLCSLINVYMLTVLGFVILSWFPLQPGGIPYRIFGYLRAVVDPVLAPLRRILPRLGPFDFSPIILIFGIGFLARLIGCRGVF